MGPDVDAYFARIGYQGPRDASLATLRALHALHPLEIPFENLDVIRGVGVGLEPETIERKLVADRRGGYCFEHNALFAAVLRALGFRVTTLAARVRWGALPHVVSSRTHMVLRVDLDGVPWLADVGFGGLTPTAPVRLDIDAAQATPHETLRVVRATAGDGETETDGEALDTWALQALVTDGWSDVYCFTFERQHPIDYEVANSYTSRHPKSRFVQNLIVTRAGERGERIALMNRELVIRRQGVAVEKRGVETPQALLEVLSERFGLEFPEGTRFGAGGAWPS